MSTIRPSSPSFPRPPHGAGVDSAMGPASMAVTEAATTALGSRRIVLLSSPTVEVYRRFGYNENQIERIMRCVAQFKAEIAAGEVTNAKPPHYIDPRVLELDCTRAASPPINAVILPRRTLISGLYKIFYWAVLLASKEDGREQDCFAAALVATRPRELPDPEARFQTECAMWRHLHELNIPNIPKYFGVVSNVLFTELYDEDVFEWLLHRIKTGSPVKNDEAYCRKVLCIFAQLIDAVEALHRNRIVHRDIKTENLFIQDGEEPVIALGDFDAAECIKAEGTSTVHVGTHRCMAPETWERCHAFSVDQRSQMVSFDQLSKGEMWTVGVLILDLLCAGQFSINCERRIYPPFSATFLDRSVLARLVNQLVFSLSQNHPTLPREISHLIKDLLDLDPSKRPSAAVTRAIVYSVYRPFASGQSSAVA